jgi:hypothetical protein
LRPWGPSGLREIIVAVELPPPGNATVTLHRLVAAP